MFSQCKSVASLFQTSSNSKSCIRFFFLAGEPRAEKKKKNLSQVTENIARKTMRYHATCQKLQDTVKRHREKTMWPKNQSFHGNVLKSLSEN